jgi:transcriptional regulator with XRE-family HTH domain
MDLKDVVATNLRRIRTAKKLTQEELAARAGISMRYVGMMERGTTSASITVLGKVADALEVEPAVLVDRTGF